MVNAPPARRSQTLATEAAPRAARRRPATGPREPRRSRCPPARAFGQTKNLPVPRSRRSLPPAQYGRTSSPLFPSHRTSSAYSNVRSLHHVMTELYFNCKHCGTQLTLPSDAVAAGDHCPACRKGYHVERRRGRVVEVGSRDWLSTTRKFVAVLLLFAPFTVLGALLCLLVLNLFAGGAHVNIAENRSVSMHERIQMCSHYLSTRGFWIIAAIVGNFFAWTTWSARDQFRK